jgi:tetratricopeptide (TPR) repeat protein
MSHEEEGAMRITKICLAAALPLAGCAGGSNQLVENGLPRGSLAVAAIDRGDLARAERLLLDSRLGNDDPALLINLGYVLMEQGRRAEAIDAWRSALAAERHREVETMAGRMVRTDQLARLVLARHEPALASTR